MGEFNSENPRLTVELRAAFGPYLGTIMSHLHDAWWKFVALVPCSVVYSSEAPKHLETVNKLNVH